MEALGINLGYLVSQIVNFAILAVLLTVLLYKPILRMLDERSARIKKGMEDAEEASRKAAETQAEFEQRMIEARQEGQSLIAQAAEEAKKVQKQIEANAREQAQQLLDRARSEIQRERELAVKELQRQAVELSIQMTQKVVGEGLDEDAHRKLIDDFITELEEAS